MMNKMLARYTSFDLVIIALLSACGIAIKPFVRLLTQVLTGTIIPAGAVAGVFYMLWIVLACCLTKKRGTAILVGTVQSLLVVVFDLLGNMGLGNLLVYILPGVVLELGLLLFPGYVSSLPSAFLAGMLANMTGAFLKGLVFMRLPSVPLIASVGLAAVSGGFGGMIACKLYALIAGINRSKEPLKKNSAARGSRCK